MAMTFERGAVDFPCPRCKERIVCSKQDTRHEVSVSDGKASVSPAWCCPNCYVVGRLKRGRISVAGDLSDEEGNAKAQIPIGTRVATIRGGTHYRNAVKIEQTARRPATYEEGADDESPPGDQDVPFSEKDEPIEPEDVPTGERMQVCPQKPQHGPLSSQGHDKCPTCGKKFASWYDKHEGEDEDEDEG